MWINQNGKVCKDLKRIINFIISQGKAYDAYIHKHHLIRDGVSIEDRYDARWVEVRDVD